MLFQTEDHFKNLFFDQSYRKNPAAQFDDVKGECGNYSYNSFPFIKEFNFTSLII